MSKRLRPWVAYGACLTALAIAGAVQHARLATAAGRLEAKEAQLAEVLDLFESLGPRASPAGQADAARGQTDIGAAVQRAASEGRLGEECVQEVKAVQVPQGSESGSASSYRIRLQDAEVEPLVRFMHGLEVTFGLRLVELDMSRSNRRTRRWDVALVLVRSA